MHPYVRRRSGEELVEYRPEEPRENLHETLTVPLFQKPAIKIGLVAAGSMIAEADTLHQSMTTFKVKAKVSKM